MKIRYFDHAATTKVSEDVLRAMIPHLKDKYGNPSSIYKIGRDNKFAIEKARKQVAELINANPNEIYFTSCGTESDNMALKGIAYANIDKGNHIITSKIEHSAILNSCKTLEKRGFKISYIDVNKDGIIDIKKLVSSINYNTILISVMSANNEIGTIQPIEEIGRIAKMYNIIFHTDAVQGCGNMELDVEKMGIDLLSLSGHKIYAPKGVGALYVKKGIDIETYLDGGHQEEGRRSGTENVAGIVGLGKACEISKVRLNRYIEKNRKLRDYYIRKVQSKMQDIGVITKINGSMNCRLPGNANISFIGIDSNELLSELDSRNICASIGSACSSGESKGSHVLRAIGLNEEISKSALRITFGEENTFEDVDYLVQNIYEIIKKIRLKKVNS